MNASSDDNETLVWDGFKSMFMREFGDEAPMRIYCNKKGAFVFVFNRMHMTFKQGTHKTFMDMICLMDERMDAVRPEELSIKKGVAKNESVKVYVGDYHFHIWFAYLPDHPKLAALNIEYGPFNLSFRNAEKRKEFIAAMKAVDTIYDQMQAARNY